MFHKLLTRWRTAAGRDAFFDLFIQAAENVARSAVLLNDLFAGFPENQELIEQIVACERAGDQIAHQVIRRLNKAFVTPIDREDILQLVSALDDVVDLIEQAAQCLVVYRVEAPMVQAQALARVLVDATRQLAEALPHVSRFGNISVYTVEVHRLENEGDRIVRGAIASLFQDRVDPMVVIRWKDIFERLEDAIDSTERAAYLLEGIVIKNA